MRQATNEIVGIMHSDMIIGPNYIENTLKHLERGKVVCATRIEPPIHPAASLYTLFVTDSIQLGLM